MGRWRRRLVCAIGGTLALGALVAPALAAPPTRIRKGGA